MMDTSESRHKIVVYLAEGHPLAAYYIRKVLEQSSRFEVIPGAGTPIDDAISQKRPSLFVIDAHAIALPLPAYLHTVRSAFNDAKILIIGRPLSDDDLSRLLFLGIGGFVTYDKVEEETCAAVEALLRGHLWVSPKVLERYVRMSSMLRNQNGGEYELFTPREGVIVGLLQRRLSNKEISQALGISERTVRFHLGNIFDKLGVRDRHSVADIAGSIKLVGQERAARTDQCGHGQRPVSLKSSRTVA